MLKGEQLGAAIRSAIEKKGVTQVAVASHFGVRQSSVTGWLQRGTISKDKLPELWSYFSDVVGPEHWGLADVPAVQSQWQAGEARGQYQTMDIASMSGPAGAPAHDGDVVMVPLFSATGSMGPGNELVTEDVILGEMPLSAAWLDLHVPGTRHGALRLVHAYGDSMAGTLNSGDFAVVDTDCRVADIDGVYVLEVGNLLFIKRVTRRMDGRHEVSSDNPNVKTIEVLDGRAEVRVCGRVVYGWNGRRF